MGDIKFFYGSSNPELGEKICKELGVEPGKVDIKKFANGETYVRLLENVRGKHVFIMQSAVEPINDNLMELLIMLDSAKLASAGKVTVLIPCYFYARQDRKAASREPITARLVANLIETAGANRVITLEVHSDQAQGFFDVPLDNLSPKRVFLKKAKELGTKDDRCGHDRPSCLAVGTGYGDYFAEVITHIDEDKSVSELFSKGL